MYTDPRSTPRIAFADTYVREDIRRQALAAQKRALRAETEYFMATIQFLDCVGIV